MASMSKPKPPPPRPSQNAAAPAAAAASPTSKDSKDTKGKKKEEDDDDDGGAGDAEKGPEKEDEKGAAEASQLKSEVEPILKSGAVVKALETALKASGTSKEVLTAQTALALQAMDGIKADDIGKVIEAADDQTLDALMRIVYAGMAVGKNCPTLLIWHAKLSDKAGIGVIMRAMCNSR